MTQQQSTSLEEQKGLIPTGLSDIVSVAIA
jgi:hypothetical protein